MAANKLKKITTVAKQLYKSGKYKKWTDAIKAASKQISGTKVGVGAVKIIQQGENKNAKVKKVYQQKRTKAGTFKGYKRISGVDTNKEAISSLRFQNDLLQKWETLINKMQDAKKMPQNKSLHSQINMDIRKAKGHVSLIKKTISILKKSIK